MTVPDLWNCEGPPLPLTPLTPDPTNLWVDAVAHIHGDDETPWIDLRTGDVAGARSPVRGSTGVPGRRRLPTGIYLPPLAAADRRSADSLITWSRRVGPGVVAQVLPGTDSSLTGECWQIWDLLAVVIDRAWDRLDGIPERATLLWPLVAGLTDTQDRIEEGLAALQGRTPQAVVPTRPRLTPRSRRSLSTRAGESSFEAAFHGREPDPRAFAAACVRRGLDILPRRPRWPHQRKARLARDIAAELGLIADKLADDRELEPRAQAFYRAARWFEVTEHNVRSLWREGNLGIVPWIDEEIERVVDELARGNDRSSRLDEATTAWLGGGTAD